MRTVLLINDLVGADKCAVQTNTSTPVEWKVGNEFLAVSAGCTHSRLIRIMTEIVLMGVKSMPFDLKQMAEIQYSF